MWLVLSWAVVLACLPVLPVAFSSPLYFDFCYWSTRFADADGSGSALWSVTTSGSIVVDSQTVMAAGDDTVSYPVLTISGIRTQLNQDGSTTVSYITGLAPTGLENSNDNLIGAVWPTLPAGALPGGISYYIDNNVTLPGTTQSTNLITMYNMPPEEWGMEAESVHAQSYLVYQAGHTSPPLLCPLPGPTTYQMKLVSVPTSVSVASQLWSSCTIANLSLVGPYTSSNALTGSAENAYTVLSATGQRNFTNTTGTYDTHIVGIAQNYLSDMVLYDEYPYLDFGGINFVHDSPPLFVNGMEYNGPDPNLYVLVRGLGSTPNEAVASGAAPYAISDLQYSVADGSTPQLTCDAGVLTEVWTFCHYSTSAPARLFNGTWTESWNVSTYGTLYSLPMMANGTFMATAISAVRTQFTFDGNITTNVSMGSEIMFARLGSIQGGYHIFPVLNDNFLFTSYPYLSDQGMLYMLQGAPQLPGQLTPWPFIQLHGFPPVESGGPPFFGTEQVGVFSYFAYQRASAGEMGCGANATSAEFAFYYSARSSNANGTWSVSAVGTLTALGPYYYPTMVKGVNSEVYFVYGASGQRLFISEQGQSYQNNILGVSSAVQSDFILYTNAGELSFDAAGVVFELDSVPIFPNGPASVPYVVLRSTTVLSAQGVNESVVTELALQGELNDTAGLTVGHLASPNVVSWTHELVVAGGSSSSMSRSLQSLLLPGDSLPTSTTDGYVIVGSLVALVGGVLLMYGSEAIVVSKYRKQRSTVWVVLSGLACGALIWASMLSFLSSTSVECDECVLPMSVQYSQKVVCLALLPALVLPLLAFAYAAWRYRFIDVKGGTSGGRTDNQVRPMETSINATQTQTAMISLGDGSDFMDASTPGADRSKTSTQGPVGFSLTSEVKRAEGCFNRCVAHFGLDWVLVSGLFTAAIVLTRVTLAYSFACDAEVKQTVWSSIISALIVWLLLSVATSIGFHGTRYRPIVAVLVCGALNIDYQMAIRTATVTFHPERLTSLATDSLFSTRLSPDNVILIGGIVGAVGVFLILSLKYRKMRLKQRLLSGRVAKTKTELGMAKQRLAEEVAQHTYTKTISAELSAQMSLINTMRPFRCSDDDRSMQTLIVSLSQKHDEQLHDYTLRRAAQNTLKEIIDSANNPKEAKSPPQRMSMASSSSNSLVSPQASQNSKSAHGSKNSTTTAGGSTVLIDSPLNAASKEWLTRTGREQDDFCLALLDAWKQRQQVPQSKRSSRDTSKAEPADTIPPPALPPPFDTFRPSLPLILSHPVTLEMFKDEVHAAHCSENTAVYVQLQRWKVTPSRAVRSKMAEYLKAEFIAADAPSSINIDSVARQKLLTRLAKSDTSVDLFVELEKEVLMLLETNHWRGFMRSSAYDVCTAVLLRNLNVLTALACSSHTQGLNVGGAEGESRGSLYSRRSGTITSQHELDADVLVADNSDALMKVADNDAMKVTDLDEDHQQHGLARHHSGRQSDERTAGPVTAVALRGEPRSPSFKSKSPQPIAEGATLVGEIAEGEE